MPHKNEPKNSEVASNTIPRLFKTEDFFSSLIYAVTCYTIKKTNNKKPQTKTPPTFTQVKEQKWEPSEV